MVAPPVMRLIGVVMLSAAVLLGAHAKGAADSCADDSDATRAVSLIRDAEDSIGLRALPEVLDSLRRLAESFAGPADIVDRIGVHRVVVREAGRIVLDEIFAILGPGGSWPDRAPTIAHLNNVVAALDTWDQAGRELLDSFDASVLTDQQRLLLSWIADDLHRVNGARGHGLRAKAMLTYCRVAQ